MHPVDLLSIRPTITSGPVQLGQRARVFSDQVGLKPDKKTQDSRDARTKLKARDSRRGDARALGDQSLGIRLVCPNIRDGEVPRAVLSFSHSSEDR